MKTRTIVEDVSGTLNRRYFAEVKVGDEIKLRAEGKNAACAAASLIDRLRYLASDAERKFVETCVIPRPNKTDETTAAPSDVERQVAETTGAPVGQAVNASLASCLRSGRWFRRRVWVESGWSHPQYRMTATRELWYRRISPKPGELLPEGQRTTIREFSAAEVIADDWELCED